LIVLAGAATLAPMWDYGFEIRHDNLLLTGLLLMWCVIRLRPKGFNLPYYRNDRRRTGVCRFQIFRLHRANFIGRFGFPAAGPQTAAMEISRGIRGWGTGNLLTVRLIFQAMGLWQLYLALNNGLSTASVNGHRFWPWQTLARLLGQTPLLLALSGSAFIAADPVFAASGEVRRKLGERFAGGTAVFTGVGCANDQPGSVCLYLLFLVPFAFIFSFRHAARLASDIKKLAGVMLPVVLTTLIFCHLLPFAVATRRHLDKPNYRQVRLM